MLNRNLNCVDCGSVFFGTSTFGNGYGVCSVCQSSRKANERFEKEMAERRKYERGFSNSNSSYSSNSSGQLSSTTLGFGIVGALALFAFIIINLISNATSTNKEYSFYTPNNGSLKQSLSAGKVYDQYNCDGLCVANPQVDIERFCHEFDGINTIDNKEIFDGRYGKITSLDREVDSYSDGKPFCRIEFTLIDDEDGKTKTGIAVVGSWTMNGEGKLVPFSTMRSTYWK